MGEELIWLLFLDICRGLRHLHSRGILHLDLKPSNILLHVEDVATDGTLQHSAASVPRAMLSDFGTCEILGEHASGIDSHVQGGYAVEFTAPERLGGAESEEPADMWSAGFVLYAMSYGDLPYHSDDPQSCRERVLAHTVLTELPEFRDASLRRLISALTAREPVARPTAEEAQSAAAAVFHNMKQGVTPCRQSGAGKPSSPKSRLMLPPNPAQLELTDGDCLHDGAVSSCEVPATDPASNTALAVPPGLETGGVESAVNT